MQYHQDYVQELEQKLQREVDARRRAYTCIRSAMDAIDMFMEQSQVSCTHCPCSLHEFTLFFGPTVKTPLECILCVACT